MTPDIHAKFIELKNNWFKLCSTLSIGLVGSLLFIYLNLPLPWMLGAIFTTTSAALIGLKIWVPGWLRIFGLLILGALFGTTISPELLDVFLDWLPMPHI